MGTPERDMTGFEGFGEEIFHGIKPSVDIPEKEGLILEEDGMEKEEAEADGHDFGFHVPCGRSSPFVRL